MIITVMPVQATMDAIQKRFDEMGRGDEMRNILRKAINDTADWTRTELHARTTRRYTIRRSALKKTDIKRVRALKGKLEAVIKVSGPPLGVYKNYSTSKQGKRKGAKMAILSSSKKEEILLYANGKTYRAFLASMGTGHEGIYQRVPGKRMKGSRNREAIKEIVSMSRAKAAETAYRETSVYTDIQAELQYNMLAHMNAVIGGNT